MSALAQIELDERDRLVPWQPCNANDWKRLQAKRAFNIALGKMLQPTANNSDDEEVSYLKALHVQWGKIELEDLPKMWAAPWEIEHLSLEPGDLLVCEGGEVGRAARLMVELEENCIIQNALHRVRSEELGHAGFLEYCLIHASNMGWFDVLCNRATIAHFTVEKFRDLWLHLPSVETQRRIADYLDAETAEIDALIAEKANMLKLLEEKQAALIRRVVTRGLDGKGDMKDSGLEWLREIPAHWEVRRFKHFSEIGNGSTPNRDRSDYWDGGDFPWLNSSIVNNRKIKTPSRYVTQKALAECHLPKVIPPSLLIAITGQGKTRGTSAVLEFEATINQHLAFIKSDDKIADHFYLSLLMDVAYPFIRNDSDGIGSTRGAITCEQIGNFYIGLPPIKEQVKILTFVKNNTCEFDNTKEDLKRSIALLKERRSALITAAVTGQLEPQILSA